MTSDLRPLHERYTQIEGPIEKYKRATGDWTPDMQHEYEAACRRADRSGPGGIVVRVEYQCPECRQPVTGIQIDSVSFFESSDHNHFGPVVAEALLITMGDCGHTYRRGAV